MSRRITIDPITRLEGHGKIELFLDDDGHIDRAYLQIPELRGFEKFCAHLRCMSWCPSYGFHQGS